MKKTAALAAVVTLAVVLALPPLAAAQLTRVRVATCARTITAGVGGPFGVAMKMGWFKQEGLEVELVPLPGSTDCVKNVATREVNYALASMEPLAIARPQGMKVKLFYTAYQNNIYGIVVPVDSPVRHITDLRGKKIGVTNMSSAGVIVARALVAEHGMNPDSDVNIVVAGEGAQPAALLRGKQVDALSQFDTQNALVENAGIKLRALESKSIEHFPSNGLMALEDTIKNKRRESIGVARAYAKAVIFSITNPEASVRILYEVFPQTKPTGKDEATAVADDVKVVRARMEAFDLARAGVKKWGENSEKNYGAYIDFLLRWKVIKERVTAADLTTNELIDEINRFDANQVIEAAKSWKPGR